MSSGKRLDFILIRENHSGDSIKDPARKDDNCSGIAGQVGQRLGLCPPGDGLGFVMGCTSGALAM